MDPMEHLHYLRTPAANPTVKAVEARYPQDVGLDEDVDTNEYTDINNKATLGTDTEIAHGVGMSVCDAHYKDSSEDDVDIKISDGHAMNNRGTEAKIKREIPPMTTSDSPAPSHFCYLCQKSVSSASAMSSHKRDNHDGKHRRIFPLQCVWCSAKPMKTRSGLSKHLTRCEGLLRLQFPLPCPFCGHECNGPKELGKHSVECMSWKQDKSGDDQVQEEIERELIRATRHPATAECMMRMFDTAELRHDTGETSLALFITRPSKRTRIGSKAYIRVVERPAPKVAHDIKLDAVLGSHAYGRLVNLSEYRRLEDKDTLWHLPFPGNGERLATTFQEMIIQSGDNALLAYKVEVYGTADYEDPHAQEVVRPEGKNAFKVENVYHDQTHKVMVGTTKWCVLVTLAVILTDGTIVVGPNNNFFHPKGLSHIWIKKVPEQGFYNVMARQLRSKFYEEATFGLYAAVNPLFNHHTTMPVTLRTLFGFKYKNKTWSGVKIAAFIFHQLYTDRKIVKSKVQGYVDEALSARSGELCMHLKIIQQMLSEMADEEVYPVSIPVNKCLTELAGNLSGEITHLNNTVVKEAVIKRVKSML
ncbi:hypothetical protein BGW42_000718 [Actinomortierella wolfii]|nr:hypothetical protein BGW42_000718 [Actinomortierella wolfii]